MTWSCSETGSAERALKRSYAETPRGGPSFIWIASASDERKRPARPAWHGPMPAVHRPTVGTAMEPGGSQGGVCRGSADSRRGSERTPSSARSGADAQRLQVDGLKTTRCGELAAMLARAPAAAEARGRSSRSSASAGGELAVAGQQPAADRRPSSSSLACPARPPPTTAAGVPVSCSPSDMVAAAEA